MRARSGSAERKGNRAYEEGRKEAAFAAWTEALQDAVPGGEVDLRIRKKYLKLVAEMRDLPAVPDEAQRRMVRGQTRLKEAAGAEGLQKAQFEMRLAVKAAPWWADAYYNLGLVQEMAGGYAEALRSLNLYLTAKPRGPDAGKVRRKIYALEVKVEDQEENLISK